MISCHLSVETLRTTTERTLGTPMCKIESWTLTTKKVLEIGKLINYKMWLVTIHVNLVTILIEGPVPSNVLQKVTAIPRSVWCWNTRDPALKEKRKQQTPRRHLELAALQREHFVDQRLLTRRQFTSYCNEHRLNPNQWIWYLYIKTIVVNHSTRYTLW